jgi:hypothetical protein
MQMKDDDNLSVFRENNDGKRFVFTNQGRCGGKENI